MNDLFKDLHLFGPMLGLETCLGEVIISLTDHQKEEGRRGEVVGVGGPLTVSL